MLDSNQTPRSKHRNPSGRIKSSREVSFCLGYYTASQRAWKHSPMNPCCAKSFRIATTNVQCSSGSSSETKWLPGQFVNSDVPQCRRYVRLADYFVMFGPYCWHRAGHDSSLQTLGQIMRLVLSDYGWSVITVALRNTPRGIPRAEDRGAVSRVSFGSCIQTLVGVIRLRSTVPVLLATSASFIGGGLYLESDYGRAGRRS